MPEPAPRHASPLWRGARVVLGVVARLPGVAAAAERLGAHTIADLLDRIGRDDAIVAIRLPPLPTELRARRVKMHRVGGRDHVANLFNEGGWYGFERPLPSVLRLAMARSSGAFYDVGANTGFYSMLAARTAPRAAIHAFEPLPTVRRLFESNLALNHLVGRIEIVDAAIGDVDGQADLFVPDTAGDWVESSASLNAEFKEHHREVLRVAVTTLDTYWRSQGSVAVAVVKVDVEGFEHAVLRGAATLLARARPIVFYEVLPRGDTDAIEALRHQVGYVDVRLGARQAVIGEPVAFDDDSWNHALVPAERVDDLADLAERAGLLVKRA